MASISSNTNRVNRWYDGGLATAGAVCFTHPLELLKVQMQIQEAKTSSITLARYILRNQGIRGLYKGLSASILRQLTYSTTRFGVYETTKQSAAKKYDKVPFYLSVILAGIGGFAGGFAGNPADIVNVRMQNDIKLPPEQRRNYKNIFHGLYVIVRTEGPTRLWAGALLNCPRAMLMTIGQISFYDLTKANLLKLSYFKDNVQTHITASIVAAIFATTLTQPVDVLKTRLMNSRKGEATIISLVIKTAQEGPLAFFKGYVPAFTRLLPHTILTFVFLEQLRMNFGVIPIPDIS